MGWESPARSGGLAALSPGPLPPPELWSHSMSQGNFHTTASEPLMRLHTHDLEQIAFCEGLIWE